MSIADFEQIRGSAIKSHFMGMEVTDGCIMRRTFVAGGTLIGTYVGKRHKGSWRVNGHDGLWAKLEQQPQAGEQFRQALVAFAEAHGVPHVVIDRRPPKG